MSLHDDAKKKYEAECSLSLLGNTRRQKLAYGLSLIYQPHIITKVGHQFREDITKERYVIYNTVSSDALRLDEK